MIHNKKFNQDTTGSINGYYILLANFSLLLLPPTIFCMNERVHREGRSKLLLHLRDTPPQSCTAEQLRASSPSLVITSWTTKFWVFSWPKWTRSISWCTWMIILKFGWELWSLELWPGLTRPPVEPTVYFEGKCRSSTSVSSGKRKNKAWQYCALSVILSGEVNQIISIILEWTKWSSRKSSLCKTLLFGLSFIPHSILSFTPLWRLDSRGDLFCCCWGQMPLDYKISP